jgi:divalent metal cation (Fe/Co/Zn/Cd) transporter
MADINRLQRTKKDERPLLLALLLSAPGPALISYAALTSGSATQLADFLRRTSELAATFVSWLVYHKLRKNPQEDAEYAARLERLTNHTVAAAMGFSGLALLIVGIVRLCSGEESRKTVLGLIIAALGLVVNVGFWRKYLSMNRRKPDPVIAAQQRLYRGKACVDIAVVTALAAVTAAPASLAARLTDSLGSVLVAGYLLYNCLDILRKLRRGNL